MRDLEPRDLEQTTLTVLRSSSSARALYVMDPEVAIFDNKRAILARHAFFQDASPRILDRLATRARWATYAPGQVIFRKGDAGLGLFAVLSGLVRISLPSENGRELVLRLIGPNEVFGEITLLDGGQRTADASAAANCHLLFLDRRDFLAALSDEPGFGIKLLAFLCQRLRQTSEQVEDLTFADPSIRLAKALLQLAERQRTANAAEIRVSTTQKELGVAIGLSRESTNKYLREWERGGHIALQKGACVDHSPIFRDRPPYAASGADCVFLCCCDFMAARPGAAAPEEE